MHCSFAIQFGKASGRDRVGSKILEKRADNGLPSSMCDIVNKEEAYVCSVFQKEDRSIAENIV